jgi:hypothetical protein
MTKAARRLQKLVDSKSHKVALAASKAVLELAVRLRDHEELEQRIAFLEKAATRAL